MRPYHFFQDNGPDEVGRAASRIAPVVGAHKMILPLLKVAGGAVAHLRPAVGAVHKAGEHVALARLCPPVPLLAYLLHLGKDLLLNDGRMSAVEYSLLLNGSVPLLLIPDGIGVGLEIDRAARVLPPFENVDDGVCVPLAWVCALRVGGGDALSPFVGRGGQHLFRPEQLCNLHRASALHTEGENPLDHCRRFLVYKPLRPVLWVFDIAVGNMGGQRLPALPLSLLHGPDLRLVSRAKNSLTQFFMPAKSLSVLWGSMVSRLSLMAIYRTPCLGKVKLM